MKIPRTHMIFALLIMPWMCVLAAQFVAEPKKKTPSAAKLKEECAHELGTQLEHFARIMQLLGNVQSQVLKHTYALLENDKENPLHQKNGSDLQSCHTMMCTFNDSLCNIEKKLQEYERFLEKLDTPITPVV
jgi:hypothetical protein